MKFNKKRLRPKDLKNPQHHDNSKSCVANELKRIYSEQPAGVATGGGKHVCNFSSNNNRVRHSHETMTNRKSCHKSAADLIIANNESVFERRGVTTNNCYGSYKYQHYGQQHLPPVFVRKQFVAPPILPEAIKVDILKKLRFYHVKVIR